MPILREEIKMNKERLKEVFQNAKETHFDVVIEVTVPTREATELIIVRNPNLDYKLEYYLNNYNENLELNRCNDVKIVSAEPIKWMD